MKFNMYAVRNAAGFWLKNFTYNTPSWVQDITDARVYKKCGQARSRITEFSKRWPNMPLPELVEFTVTESRVIDETARIEQAKAKRKEAEAKRKKEEANTALERAKKELLVAQAKVTALMNKPPTYTC